MAAPHRPPPNSTKSIQELLHMVAPIADVDPIVQGMLEEIAKEFVDNLATYSCMLAKHRRSNTVEEKDVLLHLEKNWNMQIPGYPLAVQTSKRFSTGGTVAHSARLALVKKVQAGQDGSAELQKQKQRDDAGEGVEDNNAW
eukprot:gb/GEZN01014380.1/.p1 GENE.gb/GEZN01014380.1/~~gb/GEZN01014380.1/.p1  ORF type:complete len:141 (+),score=20.51 gb/GEZN01014380.1/:145-567(+)